MVSDVCENDIFSNSVMVRRIVNGVTPISEVWQKNGVRGFMNETLLRLAGARYREKEICSLKDLNAYPEIKLLKNYTSLNNLYPQAPIEAFHIHDDEYGTSDISGAWGHIQFKLARGNRNIIDTSKSTDCDGLPAKLIHERDGSSKLWVDIRELGIYSFHNWGSALPNVVDSDVVDVIDCEYLKKQGVSRLIVTHNTKLDNFHLDYYLPGFEVKS